MKPRMQPYRGWRLALAIALVYGTILLLAWVDGSLQPFEGPLR